MSDRFTTFWARLLVVMGIVIAVSGALLAVVALLVEMPWGSITGQAVLERVFVAISLVVSGVLAGSPFIVAGQLLLILVEQRRLLGAILERLGGAERAPAPPRPS
jgi:hypothetical protein